MKNRVVYAFLAGLISVSMIAGSCDTVLAAEVRKEETVFVKIDESGKQISVVVSDQLLNIGGETQISDSSDLIDIQNVKGDETFKQNGRDLIWDSNGSSAIAYQGTTDKELPVGLSISYELDGRKIQPEELKGKSGHLKIHVSYENHTEGEAYVPFLMATAFVADQDALSNVTVDHGRVLTDGQRQTVIGYGVPGMNTYLKEIAAGTDSSLTENLNAEIPEGFTVEADAVDYQSITCMSVALNDIFGEGELDTKENVDRLKSSLNELTDAAAQLADGAVALAEGTQQLSDAGEELVNGVKQLDDGGMVLNDGAEELRNGSETLKDGAAVLADGTGQLTDGAAALSQGAGALTAGASEAKNGAGDLTKGLGQAKKGVADLKEQASEGLQQLSGGVAAISGGIGQLHDGAEQIYAGMGEAQKGAAAIAGGLGSSQTGADQLVQGSRQVKEGADSIRTLAATIVDSIPESVSEEVTYEAEIDNGDIREAVAASLRANGVDEAYISEALARIGNKSFCDTRTVTIDVQTDTTAIGSCTKQLTNAAAAVSSGAQSLEDGAAAVSGGLAQLTVGAADLSSSMETLQKGAGSLSKATGTEGELLQACGMVQTGLLDMGEALNGGTDQLIGGMDQLHAGAGALEQGLTDLESGAGSLAYGAQELYSGLAAADTGAKQLAGGSQKLAVGATALSMGTGELSKGVHTLFDGSTQLADGTVKLKDGAEKLRDGMQKFREQGIGRINDLLGDDLGELLDRIDQMRNNAAGYKSCTGIADDMDGAVKFVFVTE